MTTYRDDSLDWAHDLVKAWFINQVGSPTEPQQLGWPPILAQKNTLISAPTGSGKTFAAFLTCIDSLVRKSLAGTLSDSTEVLYISPLKAVSNDVQKNLMAPLSAILALAQSQNKCMLPINVAVRTGDTPARERQKMLRTPPHILVTTPESLYILLTAEKSREQLRQVKTVIIDEIHALAHDKRGAHLCLSLERLEAITARPPLRIGLSATQKPIKTVAHFLVGNGRPLPVIINIGHSKHMELAIEVPASELSAVASNKMWDEIYDKIAQLVAQNRSTLIFANTRREAERTAHHLAERLGAEHVVAHHGSLSRKLRLDAENRLKNGALKALVATASLELGIDIGSVDLVCQLGSPRSIAVMLQRVGRAGHWHGAISKGRLFATTRDELVECAALLYAINEEDLDKLIIPHEPLDILAQQLVATCATGDWLEDELFALVTRSYHYEHLTREQFNILINMLAEGISGTRGRYGAYLFRDQINGVVKARRGSRFTAITSGGAIPDNGLFSVLAEPNNAVVGTLDEDFAIESNKGDVILLGSTSWKIKQIESKSSRVFVENAHGAPPTVPFWRGEAPGRTDELSLRLSNLRQLVNELLPAECSANIASRDQPLTAPAQHWLQKNCNLDSAGSEQIIDYFLQGRALLGTVPSQKTIIAERFFDEAGGMQLIIHAPFGARINKAWGLALRKCFCRNFNFELQAAATDNGINISLTEQHSFPLLDVFHFLHVNTIKDVLVQAILQSPLFHTRWRWDAGRALALVRFRYGKKVPPNILRMRSEDLLAAVFPDVAACQDNLGGRPIELPDHPLVNETMKDALHEALDFDGLLQLLEQIQQKTIRCIAVDTPTPSAFCHEILNANPYAFLDDAPLEERRARAVEMRHMLPAAVAQHLGKLDEEAIALVRQQAWPDIRDADELHDLLQTLIMLPEQHLQQQDESYAWHNYFEQLVAAKRAGTAIIDGQLVWFAAEKVQSLQLIYPQALTQQQISHGVAPTTEREDEVYALVRGWIMHLGPISSSYLSSLLLLPQPEIEQALLRMEASGLILRGHFSSSTEQEWCERRLLARIHQLTLGRLRKEIEPVTAAQFTRWLLNWQHVATGTQLSGEEGLLRIIEQLQGFEIPAKAWEQEIFAKRMVRYDPQQLDRLCLMGIVGWGRLSAWSATNEHKDKVNEVKRIIPTSIAPITFFVREKRDWMPQISGEPDDDSLNGLSHIGQDIYRYLQQHGASFFNDIHLGISHLKSEIELGLWELVTAGIATADGFDNLRSLIDPKRRLLRKSRRPRMHQYSTGRWSLLKNTALTDNNKQLEALCWLLLQRYGVVFRDLLGREKLLPRWRELLITLRRLEDKGEIRGGRFVDGFLGEQFALPYAIESLRAIKRKEPCTEIITLSAADPLNLIGSILPGPRISAVTNGRVLLQNGMQLPAKVVN